MSDNEAKVAGNTLTFVRHHKVVLNERKRHRVLGSGCLPRAAFHGLDANGGLGERHALRAVLSQEHVQSILLAGVTLAVRV
jgi:hypothetical protein